VGAAAGGSDSGLGKLASDGEEGGTVERGEERLGAERGRRGRKVAAVFGFWWRRSGEQRRRQK